MPVVPVDEVGADDIGQLTSFYAAEFDDHGRLSRLRKYLNLEIDEEDCPKLVFDDQYSYSTDGALKTRTLIRADGNESRWFFESSNEAGFWRDSSLAHDQLTELESQVMSDVRTTDLRGDEFTASLVPSYLTSAEQVLRTATQDPRSVVLLLIPGRKNDLVQLHPLHPPNDVDTLLADLTMVLKPAMLENELPLVYPNADSLSGIDRFFADHQIRALAAHPVQAQFDETTNFGMIAMLAFRDWPATSSEQVMSLLKRAAVFVELLIEFGRRNIPIPRVGDASNPPQE